MIRPAAPQLVAFRNAYASALRQYVREASETSLTVAYELGRTAVSQQLSVLDLAVAYQEGLAQLLSDPGPVGEASELVRAAGDFFLESLASFEMLHRGADAARDTIGQHRRRTRLSRQLSTFLADSSLAMSPESLEEMLRLAVDHAREIIGAACCLATVAGGGSPCAAQAISYAGADRDWLWARWLDLPSIYRLLAEQGGSLRLAGEQSADVLAAATTRPLPAMHSWLAASLTALDSTPIGAIQAFGKQRGNFSDDDEATLTHLAQMVSGAAERMRLYHHGGPT